jgi:hypothetical protein
MQAMIPCNVALITIAALFYAWRDLYVPRRRGINHLQERVTDLLWAVESHIEINMSAGTASPHFPNIDPSENDLDDSVESDVVVGMFAIYIDVECRACQGKHSFHYAGNKQRQVDSTFEFTCPVVNKSTWIWWLGKSEQVKQLPADVILLDWVAS